MQRISTKQTATSHLKSLNTQKDHYNGGGNPGPSLGDVQEM